MPKFRKKPVVVEAEQFVIGDGPLPPGVHGAEGGHFYVMTAHNQTVFVVRGDWIIAEPDGRGYYPCKSDIFAATYEPVEDPTP
jgi:hypothetical protein